MKQETAITFWIIEDNRAYRRSVKRAARTVADLDCADDFESAEEALQALKDASAVKQPDVVLLDIGLPGESGLEALPKFKAAAPDTKFVILTAFDDNEKIYRAICAGAIGYVLKTDDTESVANVLRDAHRGGSPMTPKVAKHVLEQFAQVASRADDNDTSVKDYDLTKREREVLQYMAEGETKKEIAAQLHISVHTVIAHLRKIYQKLHVTTNTAAVAKAIRERLI